MKENLLFILSALGLTAVVVVVLIVRLMRPPRGRNVAQDQVNVRIYKDQWVELDSELALGRLSAQDHAQSRDELTRRLLEDTSASQETAPAQSRRPIPTSVVLALFLPLAAWATYLALGTPDALDPRQRANGSDQHAQLQAMADSLAQKLKADGGNAERWVMLGRTYRALQQHEKALQAYDQALGLKADDDIRVERAEILARKNQDQFDGEPWQVIREVLARDPRHLGALLLAGSASFESGQFEQAAAYWQKVRTQLPPNDENLPGLEAAIGRARERAGLPAEASAHSKAMPTPSADAAQARVSGRLSLDPALQAKVAPTDTVFVYALMANGERMPLAIVRATVADLPLDFVLDVRQAMSPDRTLSRQKEVMLRARISRSGNAMPQSGDLTGSLGPVKVGSQKNVLRIQEEVR